MARVGSFKKCLNQMVESVGREPSLMMAIWFCDSKRHYILARVGEDNPDGVLELGEEMRCVLAPTYNELKELLKPRQIDIFKEDVNVHNSKDLQTGQ